MRVQAKTAVLLMLGAMLAACAPRVDKTVDANIFDQHDLSDMRAGIWVDPTGCDHWIIDDGLEGYLSQRLDRNGKPVCSGVAPPGYAVGPFKKGATVPDSL